MSREDLEDQMNSLKGFPSFEMAELVTHGIWGAVVTTTRAFGKVELKVDTNSNRVFVKIELRWLFKNKRFQKLHVAWLKRAETRCKEHLPQGWRALIYYA